MAGSVRVHALEAPAHRREVHDGAVTRAVNSSLTATFWSPRAVLASMGNSLKNAMTANHRPPRLADYVGACENPWVLSAPPPRSGFAVGIDPLFPKRVKFQGVHLLQ